MRIEVDYIGRRDQVCNNWFLLHASPGVLHVHAASGMSDHQKECPLGRLRCGLDGQAHWRRTQEDGQHPDKDAARLMSYRARLAHSSQ